LEYFFEFPEIFDYVGLPAALFVSIRLTLDPVDGYGGLVTAFERETDWEMTVDVADIFSNADIQPQAITIFPNMAYLGCWLFGICQPAERPRVKIKVSAFWNQGFNNVFKADQFGASITESVLDVQGMRDTTGVASACKTCGHHPPASRVFTIRNARSNEPVVKSLQPSPLVDSHLDTGVLDPVVEPSTGWLGSWVKI
jgi:hypothetical protein